MSTFVHAIFRSVPDAEDPVSVERWEAYSYPVSIYAGGETLEEVRSAWLDAARTHFGAEFDDISFVPHVERMLLDGVWARITVGNDQAALRDSVARRMQLALTVQEQLEDFRQNALLAATGDAVIICCLPSDTLGTVLDQMGDHDSVLICAEVSELGLWWMPLAGGASIDADKLQHPQSLAELGLSRTSTVSDVIVQMESRREGSGAVSHANPVLIG